MNLTPGHDKSILNVPSIDHVRVSDADTVFICVPPIHCGPGCVGGDASSQHSNSNPIDGDHEPS